MRALVRGAGEQGRLLARDPAGRSGKREVCLGDVREPAAPLNPRCRLVPVDARDPAAVATAAASAYVAVTTLPGSLGVARSPTLAQA